MRSYRGQVFLVFNRCMVVSLFWWFSPHLRQGNTPNGYCFAPRSFFPVWGRCNFLSQLLSTDFNAVMWQPSLVATACVAPHESSESVYLCPIYVTFYLCLFPYLQHSHSQRQVKSAAIWPPSLSLDAACRIAVDKGYSPLLLLFLFCIFLSAELI